MAKYKDTQHRGKSEFCKRRRREPWKKRHARRYGTANAEESMSVIREWCEHNGCELHVRNNGHHWIINPDGWPIRDGAGNPVHLIQWWPSTAKCVIACRWTEGVHLHGVDQLIAEVERAIKLTSRKGWTKDTHKLHGIEETA